MCARTLWSIYRPDQEPQSFGELRDKIPRTGQIVQHSALQPVSYMFIYLIFGEVVVRLEILTVHTGCVCVFVQVFNSFLAFSS